MRTRVAGLTLLGGLLVALGWIIANQSLPAQAPKGGDAKKTSRFEVIGAGLITAVLIDHESGKTWALAPGGMMEGRGNFDGDNQEFAWVPITKFDDLENYRRWVKVQQDKAMKMREEMFEKDRKFEDERDRKEKKE